MKMWTVLIYSMFKQLKSFIFPNDNKWSFLCVLPKTFPFFKLFFSLTLLKKIDFSIIGNLRHSVNENVIIGSSDFLFWKINVFLKIAKPKIINFIVFNEESIITNFKHQKKENFKTSTLNLKYLLVFFSCKSVSSNYIIITTSQEPFSQWFRTSNIVNF